MATLNELIDKLNEDLSREYSHMHFYIHAAATVTGLHREEYQELFMKEAADEMGHVHEFGKLILGLGGQPNPVVAPFFHAHNPDPKTLIQEAIKMEEEVVANYVQRMDDAEELEKNGGIDKVHGRWVHIFLEDQIIDSRQTVDQFREILK
ncbi:MAG: ferritin-like domain-containing protein [Crenarchaeota archaeon]|nr:MAG: ferritin-like domain-containing protein [Thermoproteota archaeon]